ncbi:MAG TPA: enoyl-CoA hydratase/isomerase family protein [Solirubrobacteraceae bacterium]|nr:enoyl-CoA hydratase/isomerase family protein [Solirubrobacteraceae bacterium]
MSEEISIRPATEHVMLVEFGRPPHNYFDGALIGAIADAYEQLDRGGTCRAIVLCSEGKNFCAGANFAAKNPAEGDLYEQAVRLFAAGLPVVAAVQGAAVGGGLGVALSADFRVASPDSRFSANFARLGIHHGFGITVTLPLVVGAQRALELLYTGARLHGEDAYRIGLCDRLVASDRLRDGAVELAEEIATSSPLAVRSIRQTMRRDLADRIREATAHEAAAQASQFATSDFREGVSAAAERRPPRFSGS